MINSFSEYEDKCKKRILVKKYTEPFEKLKITSEVLMADTIVANEDGSVVIAPEIAASICIAPRTEYLVYERNSKILMIP